MRALKITKLLNLITAGAAMGGIAIGGIYIGAHLNTKGDPQDDTRFDISSLNNSTLIRPFSGIPRAESLITCLTDQFSSLTSLNQLVITNINAGAQTFTLSAVSNSTYYMDNKSATIRWNVPPQDNDFTQITGGTFDIDLLIWEEMSSDRNTFLNAMKTKFPSLDVNQLYIDASTIDNDNRSAEVRVASDSTLYDTTKTATVIAGFTQSIDLSFNNSTLTQSVVTSTPTIKYHGTAISNTASGLEWTCTTTASPVDFSSTNGTLTLTSGVQFAGGMYTITATYTRDGNTFTARQQVYVQAFNKTAIYVPGTHLGTHLYLLDPVSPYYNQVTTYGGGLYSGNSWTSNQINGGFIMQKASTDPWSTGMGPNGDWYYVTKVNTNFPAGTTWVLGARNLTKGINVGCQMYFQQIIIARGNSYDAGDIIYITYETYGTPVRVN